MTRLFKSYWRITCSIISFISLVIYFQLFCSNQHPVLDGFVISVFIYFIIHLLFPNKKVSHKYAGRIRAILAFIMAVSIIITLLPEMVQILYSSMVTIVLHQSVNNIVYPNLSQHVFIWCIIDTLSSILIFLSLTWFEKQGSLQSKWSFKTLSLFILVPSLITILKCFLNIYNDNYIGISALIIISLLINDMALLDYHRISMESKHIHNDNSCRCKRYIDNKIRTIFQRINNEQKMPTNVIDNRCNNINNKKKIGLVIPCYNEDQSIQLFYQTVEKVFRNMKNHGMHYDYEYLFINDGSADKTLQIIRHLHAIDPKHVHYISFARNFGKESAMAAGFNNITGDYVAEMDVDLQDPPSLLPKMLKYINEDGYDCVGCIQTSRKQNPIRAFLSKHFYSVLNRISSVKIQPNVRDFRLMTRQFLNTFLQLHERNRFTKGLFSWIGFRVKFLKYQGRPRAAGKSDWSLHSLFEYSLEAIIDFSDVPLRIATIVGGLSCLMAFLGILFVIIRAIFWGGAVNGWPSLVSIMLLIGGIQLFCLGIIGKYIGKIYSEVKDRPLYTIKEKK